jgi:hypothetical protein
MFSRAARIFNLTYIFVIGSLSAALFAPSLLLADQITLSYTGHLYSSDFPEISSDATFTGDFTYDTDSAGIPFSNVNGVLYPQIQPGDHLELNVGGFNFLVIPGPLSYYGTAATVFPGPAATAPNATGQFGVYAEANNGDIFTTTYQSSQLDLLYMSAGFAGKNGFLASTALPDAFDVANVLFGGASGISLLVSDSSGGDLQLQGFIDSVQSSAVPEPLSVPIIAACFGAVIFWRKYSRWAREQKGNRPSANW